MYPDYVADFIDMFVQPKTKGHNQNDASDIIYISNVCHTNALDLIVEKSFKRNGYYDQDGGEKYFSCIFKDKVRYMENAKYENPQLIGRVLSLANYFICSTEVIYLEDLKLMTEQDILTITADYKTAYLDGLSKAIKYAISSLQKINISKCYEALNRAENEMEEAESERDYAETESLDHQIRIIWDRIAHRSTAKSMLDILLGIERQQLVTFNKKYKEELPNVVRDLVIKNTKNSKLVANNDVSKLKLYEFDFVSFADDLAEYIDFSERELV